VLGRWELKRKFLVNSRSGGRKVKGPLTAAFCLTVVTYGFLYYSQPSAPPDKTTMIVVFGIWLGVAALVSWIMRRKGAKG
jgi:hypothetical protein